MSSVNRSLFQQRLQEAVLFAANAHWLQVRKGTNEPYILHPLAVMRKALRLGFPRLAIPGVLHDVPEDTSKTIEAIEAHFGAEVARLVLAMSEPGKGSETWEERKQHTVLFMEHAPLDVVVLTYLDKLCNLKDSIAYKKQFGVSFFAQSSNATEEKQLWYFWSLAKIFTVRLCDSNPGLAIEYTELVNEAFDVHLLISV